MDADYVKIRMEDAAETMRCLPFVGMPPVVSPWPDYVLDYPEKIIKPKATAEDIALMDEALLWLRFLPAVSDRRLVWKRAEGTPWRVLDALFDRDIRTLKKDHNAALSLIARTLY